MNIDSMVDNWTEELFAATHEQRNQCPVCADYFCDDGVEHEGVSFCSDECLSEFKGESMEEKTKGEQVVEAIHKLVYENIKELREDYYDINIKILKAGFNITTVEKEKYDE